MTRARWYLVGACLLLGLTGCARMWFAEREPWRREAEVACLQSGAVKEGPSVAIIKAIEGPGVCGADYPLRVAALGDAAALGFFDEPARPPGAIRGAPDFPPAPQAAPPDYPYQSYPADRQSTAAPGAPVSIAPPPRSEPVD